jgi:2-oxo-4-hydroxy-4-carboxy-5-ureidoimidazoline decarboxylase
MTESSLILAQVNALDRPCFVAALGHLFEGPPWIVEAAWEARPFATLDDLQSKLVAVMEAAPVERQVALIQAHPDLVGRAALAGTLSPASTGEQTAAGLDQLTPDEIATFTRLNAEYRERFGFPFVVCARENKKDSILAGFAQRMDHTRDEEITTALAEIAKICRLRLLDTIRAVE